MALPLRETVHQVTTSQPLTTLPSPPTDAASRYQGSDSSFTFLWRWTQVGSVFPPATVSVKDVELSFFINVWSMNVRISVGCVVQTSFFTSFENKRTKKSKKTELNEEFIQLAAFFNSQNQDFFFTNEYHFPY